MDKIATSAPFFNSNAPTLKNAIERINEIIDFINSQPTAPDKDVCECRTDRGVKYKCHKCINEETDKIISEDKDAVPADVCPTCKGIGKVFSAWESQRLVDCPACGGKENGE